MPEVDQNVERGPQADSTGPTTGSWGAAGAVVAMVVCCVGHGLLLAFGFAGVGAGIGALAGSPVVVLGTAVIFAVGGAVLARRVRRRRRTKSGKDLP